MTHLTNYFWSISCCFNILFSMCLASLIAIQIFLVWEHFNACLKIWNKNIIFVSEHFDNPLVLINPSYFVSYFILIFPNNKMKRLLEPVNDMNYLSCKKNQHTTSCNAKMPKWTLKSVNEITSQVYCLWRFYTLDHSPYNVARIDLTPPIHFWSYSS